jgi:recombination protein RecT
MNTEVVKKELSPSERFTAMVIEEQRKQGGLGLTDAQKVLLTHLFIKCDISFQEAETKRLSQGKNDRPPIIWANVNYKKLAIDAYRRVQLGLDALIDNHIHVIAYYTERDKLYKIALDIGYAGKDYYRREMAMIKPLDIRYEIKYSTDKFTPIKYGFKTPIEGYIFEITNPFDRGEVEGGFGYIIYENPNLNKLVIVSESQFRQSEAKSKTPSFWKEYPIQMRFSKLVSRVTSTLAVDPAKINDSYLAVEAEDRDEEAIIADLLEAQQAGDVIDIVSEQEKPETQVETPKKPDPGF